MTGRMEIKQLDKKSYISLSQKIRLHPLQTFAWGEVKQSNWGTVRLGVFKGNKALSILTMLVRDIPATGKKFAYIPRGIAVCDLNRLQDVLKVVIEFGGEKGFSHLLIDTDLDYQRLFEDSKKYLSKLQEIYESSKFTQGGRQEQPSRTVVLDLSKSEQQVLFEMKSKHRQYIRKAQRNGVKVKIENIFNSSDFSKIISEMKQQKGHIFHDPVYYEKIWQAFNAESRVLMLSARIQREVVGSYMIILGNDTAYEMYGGCTSKGKKVLASYLLKWEGIKYCKSLKKRFYDQWGAEFRYPGLVQFKQGFGGKIVNFLPQYYYVYNKTSFLVYRVFRKVNSLGAVR